MRTRSVTDQKTELAHILLIRGWELNEMLSTDDAPLWDYPPSTPRDMKEGMSGHPSGIFIHSADEQGLCTVEPATWSSQWNQHSRVFNEIQELIPWLPAIEHWRAPTRDR